MRTRPPLALEAMTSQGYSVCERKNAFSAWLQKHPEERFNYFRFNSYCRTNSSVKYSHFDLFGGCVFAIAINDERGRAALSAYLERLFLKTNPMPSSGLRKAFTQMLHQHGLHWTDCYDNPKMK